MYRLSRTGKNLDKHRPNINLLSGNRNSNTDIEIKNSYLKPHVPWYILYPTPNPTFNYKLKFKHHFFVSFKKILLLLFSYSPPPPPKKKKKLEREKNCGCQTGHTFGHLLDRKQCGISYRYWLATCRYM